MSILIDYGARSRFQQKLSKVVIAATAANAHFVRDLNLGRVVSTAARLNVWNFRRAAAQKFPRCERTQHKINRSGVGSILTFAAQCTKVRFSFYSAVDAKVSGCCPLITT